MIAKTFYFSCLLKWFYYSVNEYCEFRVHCLYLGCNKTLTTKKGTFHSPNYPNKHSDGEYCSWKISVSPGKRIYLTFSNLSFHNQNNASKLIVYDGKNVSGEVLGVFYGNLPPAWKELYSSSNHMLVIFVSNATDSYTGFNASYSFIERGGKFCQGKFCFIVLIERKELKLARFLPNAMP